MRRTSLCLLLAAGSAFLGAQDATRLRQDVEQLVKPELLGRETGQPGCIKAATYLANRMRDLGLTPLSGTGMGGETPFHYTYTLNAALAPTLSAGGQTLIPVEDFEAAGEGRLAGESVYLGFGIQDPLLGWNDYAGREVAGRWVVVDEGHPEGWSFLGFIPSATVAAKAEAAEAAGARGLIVVRRRTTTQGRWTPADWNRTGTYTLIDRLLRGDVVGWHQGRFEWGPRALGCRSILANPLLPDIQQIVNEKIKFREPFRPFAPAVLAERATEFFDLELPEATTAPEYFMLSVCGVREEKKGLIPAVTHVDGTSRLQLVRREGNPRYHDLIKAFGDRTGVPILLNTSFNLKGEPIVNTPYDALRTFLWSDMDCVVIGNFLVEKGDIQWL